VLVDTGAAKLFGPTLGYVLQNLKAAGYKPAQVDAVIITHLHGDHMGGLNDASGQPVFANLLLHIADPTAAAIRQAGFTTIGLLGTRFTMEQAFYRDRLSERHGLQVIVPDLDDRATIHRIIYDELCLGAVLPESRLEYRRIMQSLAAQGAQAIILGCTEIALLVDQQDCAVPLFDTTAIHARAAVAAALVQ